MQIQKKTVIIMSLCIILILSGVLIIFLLTKLNTISPTKMLHIMSDHGDLEASNVLYREVGGGDSKWEIRAKKASYVQKENQASFKDVEIKVFLSDGMTLLMVGNRGQLNTVSKDITISGNVSMNSDREELLKADYLQYSSTKKKVHTDAPVLMQIQGMRITGVSST